MKSVLISIKPKWCELIASGKKTVEVRKTKPKLETPFKCYIYCTKGNQYLQSRNNAMFYLEDRDFIGGHGAGLYRRLNGTVMGEFVCDRIDYVGWISTPAKLDWKNHYNKDSCLTNNQLYDYSNGGCYYEWHITDLVIYDKPKKLSDFRSYNVKTYMDESGFPMPTHEITRPPQSWCYVEEVEE